MVVIRLLTYLSHLQLPNNYLVVLISPRILRCYLKGVINLLGGWGMKREDKEERWLPMRWEKRNIYPPSQCICSLHQWWARQASPCGLSRRIMFYPYKIPLQNDEILELEKAKKHLIKDFPNQKPWTWVVPEMFTGVG